LTVFDGRIIVIFSKAGAKVLLFFDIRKFSGIFLQKKLKIISQGCKIRKKKRFETKNLAIQNKIRIFAHFLYARTYAHTLT